MISVINHSYPKRILPILKMANKIKTKISIGDRFIRSVDCMKSKFYPFPPPVQCAHSANLLAKAQSTSIPRARMLEILFPIYIFLK